MPRVPTLALLCAASLAACVEPDRFDPFGPLGPEDTDGLDLPAEPWSEGESEAESLALSDGPRARLCDAQAGFYDSDEALETLAGCTHVRGSLRIDGPVTSLRALASLEVVDAIHVRETPMRSLTGLDQLRRVGSLLIQSSALESLTGLDHPELTVEALRIESANVLTDLETSMLVTGEAVVVRNASLTNEEARAFVQSFGPDVFGRWSLNGGSGPDVPCPYAGDGQCDDGLYCAVGTDDDCGDGDGDGDGTVGDGDGTPLVLELEGTAASGSEMVPMVAHDQHPGHFDIDVRPGSCTATDWPAVDTPWLALDRNGNGRIDDGSELFGSGTRLREGTAATHGFAALAELDVNGDGLVSAADPRFDELVAWADHDADRRSDPDEMSTLAELGITALTVSHVVDPICDARGNCVREQSTFAARDESGRARTGRVLDLHLRCR